MKKIQEFFKKLMMGRYGVDHFNVSLIYLLFILSLLSIFVSTASLFRVIRLASAFLTIYILFRMFSKNLNKRYQENIKFLKATKPLRGELELLGLKWKDRKTYRYVKCPNCKNVMRVPKNVGKIKIKCKKCGHDFIKRV